MKKKLIALALIIIVALAAIVGLYLLLHRAHNASQTPTPAASRQIAEVTPEVPLETKADLAIAPKIVTPEVEPPPAEPTEPPHFEDLPKELQEKYIDDRNAIIARTYANRFKMTEEEWKALSKKEQRLLIRKGTKQ